MLGLNIQNFRRFAPNEIGFCNFGHFSLPENREEISIFSYRVGEEIRVFGQNIYPCQDKLECPYSVEHVYTTFFVKDREI